MRDEWEDKAIDELMDAIIDYRGKTPKKTHSGVPLITAKIIKGGRIDEPSEFIAVEEYDDWMRRGLPKAGDILITTEAPMGEVAQLNSANVALAQRVILLRGKEGLLDNSFLKFVLQSSTVQHRLRARESGTTVTGIKQKELRKVLIPTPPFPEQKRIAAVLGALDDKIELNRKMNKTLEAMAQAIFKSWFVDFESFRDGGMVDSELGPIPKGWDAGSLGELARVNTGKRQKSRASEKDSDHQVPLVGGAGQIAWTKKALFTQPVITTGRVGTLGVVLQWNEPIWPSDNVLVVSPNDSYWLEFLYQHMTRKDLANLNRGSTQPMLTQKDIKNVRFAVPPFELIQHFANVVDPLRKHLESNLQESNTLVNLRDTLLPKLISGEVRVPEADVDIEAIA